MSTHQRRHEETHPWISFEHQIRKSQMWVMLGEALSKCQHLASTPLQPNFARKLAEVYLVRGAVATAAIEGNTLDEEQVNELRESGDRLPPSQQYLKQEIDNVIDCLTYIDQTSRAGEHFLPTVAWLKQQNKMLQHDLEVEDHVVPGEYTTTQLVAGSYRAAPPEDVEVLMDRLVDWLQKLLTPVYAPDATPDTKFFNAFFAATLGHLYIAWIHPFGDGNGRTARMLECAILAHSGVVPWLSSNLLSDHYNQTRSRYYMRLQAASRERDVDGFLSYSAQGFVDQLRKQISDVQVQQRRTAWVNYVHEATKDEPSGDTVKRRRALVLCMPEKFTKSADLRRLTPELAEMYATKTTKTLTRDLTRLEELELVERRGPSARARVDQMDALMPIAQQS